MNLVTDDAITFLSFEMLQEVVLKAIDKQADIENPGDPLRAFKTARDRKMTVLDAMNILAHYPQDQKAALMGYWREFGGHR